jgi:hypothetical protein
LEKREQRTKAELRDEHRTGMDTCESCKEVLGPGARWWVCTGCKRECMSSLHLPWAKGKRQTDATTKDGEYSNAV